MVRKASEMEEFREIQGITGADLKLIEASFESPSSMIYLLRTSSSLLNEETKASDVFKKAYKHLYETGFIRRDLDLSFAFGRFLNDLHNSDLFVDCTKKFKSNRDYERFQAIDDRKAMMFESIIRDIAKLNNFQVALVMKKYGLNGEKPKTLNELTSWSGKSTDLVENAIRRAMVKLQQPEMSRFFRAVYSYDISEDDTVNKKVHKSSVK